LIGFNYNPRIWWFFSYKQDWKKLNFYFTLFIVAIATLSNIYKDARAYWYLFPTVGALLANAGVVFGHITGEKIWKDPDIKEGETIEKEIINEENEFLEIKE